MTDFSVLSPPDDAIRRDLYRKHTISKVLIALSEEPCYISELSGRLGLARDTISSSILYLENTGLIYGVSDRTSDERLTTIIKVKRNKFKRRLNFRLAHNLIKRVEFYYITERGEGFLVHAKKSLGWT